MPFSDDLEAELTPYRDEYRAIVNNWLRAGTFGLTYPAFLVESFHYVKHSCSLMRNAQVKLDDTHRALSCYLEKHIVEELGHEEWILSDLDHLGYDCRQVRMSQPLPETINLIGSQLYVVNHLHPAGLLGYVYTMESTPPSEESLTYIQNTFSIDPQAMTFLKRHGEADIEHRRELKIVLNEFLVNSQARQAAITSATLGLSNVNRLLARLRSGNFLDTAPILTEKEVVEANCWPYQSIPRIPQRTANTLAS